jgi:hypothetical protein
MKKKNKINLCIILAVFMAAVMARTAYGGGSVYDSTGTRDPFVPLVGDASHRSGMGLSGIMAVEEISLQGIVLNAAGKKSAIINGEIMSEGETKGSISIKAIKDNGVTVVLNGTEYSIQLYE